MPGTGQKSSHIDKGTVISIGVAVMLATVVFLAGAIYTKVDRLDGLKIETRLSRIEAILENKKAASLPWQNLHKPIPQTDAKAGSEQGPHIDWQIWHGGTPARLIVR